MSCTSISYTLFSFEHCIDPTTFIWFSPWSLVQHSKDACLEEESRFDSVWLIAILENLTPLVKILQELTLEYKALSTFLSMHLNSSIATHLHLVPMPDSLHFCYYWIGCFMPLILCTCCFICLECSSCFLTSELLCVLNDSVLELPASGNLCLIPPGQAVASSACSLEI